MVQIYDVLKSLVDPILIVFVLLLISLFVFLITGKRKSDTLLLFFTIVLLYGFSIFPMSNYLSYQLEKDYINSHQNDNIKLDVIVVLSSGAYDINILNHTFLGETTIVRLIHAVQMYKKYNAKYLVCSGKGKTKISIAQLMAQMAIEFGVPKDKIRIDAKSNNTYEHALEFNKMFVDKNISVGLVTSAYHMKRSEKEFRKFFSNVLPLPSGYLYASPVGVPAFRFIPHSHSLYKNALILHEYIGQLWYRIKATTSGL